MGTTNYVIGIAAGMLDGMGLSSLKGAFMARGTYEVLKLIKAKGEGIFVRACWMSQLQYTRKNKCGIR